MSKELSVMIGATFEPNGDYPNMPYREGQITLIQRVDKKQYRFRATDGREDVAHLDWLRSYWKLVSVPPPPTGE